jgi:hypothetical protein
MYLHAGTTSLLSTVDIINLFIYFGEQYTNSPRSHGCNKDQGGNRTCRLVHTLVLPYNTCTDFSEQYKIVSNVLQSHNERVAEDRRARPELRKRPLAQYVRCMLLLIPGFRIWVTDSTYFVPPSLAYVEAQMREDGTAVVAVYGRKNRFQNLGDRRTDDTLTV